MIEKIQSILERELARVDDVSQKTGLDHDGIRSFDLLIKAYKTFSSHEKTPAAPDPTSPENQSDEALLDGLISEHEKEAEAVPQAGPEDSTSPDSP